MYTLVEIGILNALTAAALAMVVLLITPLVRRPAVVHAFWVLVLLKLVTPPIFEIPVGLRLERLASLTGSRDPSSSVGQLEQARFTPGGSATPVTSASSLTSQLVDAGHVDPPAGHASRVDGDRAAADSVAVKRDPPGSPAGVWGSAARRRWLALAIPVLLWIWVAGMAAWFTVQGWRILAFLRLATAARPACEEIQQQAQRIASALGAQRAPRIWVLDVTISPVLWALGSRARIIFPAVLLDRFDRQARATLLTHELAHFRRGDHWVRLLEFVVTGLFWWHPATWLARRKIEVAEEHCCDAWVVSQFPGQPRRYAEALLDTIDFLSEDRPRVVPVASGLGQAPFLRERIRLIMSGVAPKSMSGTTRLAVLAAAAVLLPLGPQLFEGAIRQADAALALSRADNGGGDQVPSDQDAEPPWLETAEVTADIALPGESLAGTALRLDDPIASATGDDNGSSVPAAEVNVAWAIVNSPDGRFRAVARTSGEFALKDTFQQRSFDLSAYQISSIAFAPHRDLLAAGSSDSKVYLFDCASGDAVATLSGHQAAIGSLAVSSDGRFIASGSRDGVVKLWDIDYQSEVPSRIPVQSDAINCLRYSADGRLLAIVSGDWINSRGDGVLIWDLRGGTTSRQINSASSIGAIAFGADRLVVAQWSGRTTRWDLLSGASEAAAMVDKDLVAVAAFAADAQSLLFAAANGESPTAAAAAWFQRMDRDRDGRLAWQEFQGSRGTFRKLDMNQDENVSWDEVAALQ